MVDEKNGPGDDAEDLEVTSILDPDMVQSDLSLSEEDIDLELGGGLDDLDVEDDSQAGDAEIPDIDDLLADDGADQASGQTGDMAVGEDDFDFDLDDMLADDSDFGDLDDSPLDDPDIDFELDDMTDESEEPVSDEALAAAEDEVDFDLEEILSEDEVSFEPVGADAEGPDLFAAEEEDIEEDVDFDLEEVVESIPEPRPDLQAEPDTETEIKVQDEFPGAVVEEESSQAAAFSGTETIIDFPTRPAPPPAPEEEEPELPAPAEVAVDSDFLAEVVERSVREAVTQVLERMLPELIEEVVGRELEKLRQELVEED